MSSLAACSAHRQCDSNADSRRSMRALARIQTIIEQRAQEFPRAMRNAPRPWSPVKESEFSSMRSIHEALTELPPAIPEPLSWLTVLPLTAKLPLDVPKGAVAAILPHSDLHIHHYDAESVRDETYQVYANLSWYRAALRHPSLRYRGFREGTGCKLAVWHASMRLVIEGAATAAQGYTHLWLVDSDLSFKFFSVPAFQALIAHSAPLLSQPSILPWARGQRATDFASLKGTTAFGKEHPTGRDRITKFAHGPGSSQVGDYVMGD